jgi:hypothetical protein
MCSIYLYVLYVVCMFVYQVSSIYVDMYGLMILNYYVLFLYMLYVVFMLCHVCVVQCIVEFKSSLELVLCLLYMLRL